MFADVGESYVDIIVGPNPLGQVEIVKQILDCTHHPEKDVARFTFRFWYMLALELRRLVLDQPRDARALAGWGGATGRAATVGGGWWRRGGFAEAAALVGAAVAAAGKRSSACAHTRRRRMGDGPAKEQLLLNYRPFFAKLVDLCLKLFLFPAGSAPLTDEDSEDFHNFRSRVGHARPCFGPRCMTRIPHHLIGPRAPLRIHRSKNCSRTAMKSFRREMPWTDAPSSSCRCW